MKIRLRPKPFKLQQRKRSIKLKLQQRKRIKELSQDTFVEGFDPSQVKFENSRPFDMSPPQLHDEEIDRAGEDSPDAALVYLREEDWEKVSTWLAKSKTKWLHNLEIDAMMYVFRERTSLKRWELHRVAFMSVVFSNMIKKEYESFKAGIRKYKLHHLLLQYGKGVLPPHGRTQEIWNVDVDWLYVPVHVSGNHWISLCISVVTRSIDVFDCSGRKRYKEVDAFANLVPRIVKAVQPPRCHKDFNVAAYTVHYVPMGKLNKSACDCGVYTIKFIECHLLGLKLSVVNDGNIKEARHRVLWDL
ncbi:uncharacterized protein LOC106405519 isoform X2 [Brassica napus]|uniref:uncharacterized protein LOC106405519 isoform X2 n=1 Tax=Brassica napus TaxID=3708 RepID=UPI002079B3AE|nr:uncharacterized protein LOC106405519 isoform X2 [Brassica napus]